MIKKMTRLILLIAIFTLTFLNSNVYAKEACTRDTVVKRFGINDQSDKNNGIIKFSITKGTFTVNIKVIDENYVPKDGEGERILKEETIILNANAKNGNISTEFTYDANVNLSEDDQKKGKKVIVNFTLNDKDDEKCDIEKSAPYIRTLILPNKPETQYKKNPQYDTLCANLRNGVWNDKFYKYISKEVFLKYNPRATNSTNKYAKELAQYCYQQYVITSYNDENIAFYIASAVKAYKNSLKTTINVKEPDAKIPTENRFNLSNAGSADYNRFNQGQSLTCDAKNIGNSSKSSYANMKTFYATDTQTSSIYLQHTVTCKKTCSETLTVEYGPPVSTKAGLCFEYKVKVKSKVECDSVVTGGPPQPGEYPVCEPVPICNEIEGKEHQAGPNEDFDKCITKCDKGKYTQNCINKCYNQVYGKKSNSKLSNAQVTVPSLKLAYQDVGTSCDYDSLGGNYYWDSNGELNWNPGSGCAAYSPYYYKYQSERTAYDNNRGAYYPDSNGFKHNSNGCSDDCYYSGCSQGDFLSEAEADAAYRSDLNRYDAFVSDCEAKASCSTKSAEFTIKVNNRTKDNPNQDNWINYDKATLTGSHISDPGEIILNRSGCYGANQIEQEYLTEWSFPGTWINNKTGEIKYEPIKDSAWHKKKDYFCTNLNSANVNVFWWYYGLTRDKQYLPSDSELKNLDYNIKASTKNFGHYGWNIDVGCFYSLYEKSNSDGIPAECTNPEYYQKHPDMCETDPGDKGDTTRGTISYRIRSVDNKNIFPSTEGKETTDPNEKGRQAGFNWTIDATVIKNKDYIIAPEVLIKNIQTKGNTIYDDESDSSNDLDYRFYLDRTALNRIRSYSKESGNGKYTTFTGNFTIVNGVSVYNSSLFRGSGAYLDGRYIKRKGVLGCNNQANDGACEKYSQIIVTD